MSTTEFIYLVYFISIIFHVLSALNTAFFVIPLQTKQAGVKNGLSILRKQLLWKGILSLAVSIFAVLILSLRFIIKDEEIIRFLIGSLIIGHALAIFGKSLLDFKIWRHHFTPEKVEHSRNLPD